MKYLTHEQLHKAITTGLNLYKELANVNGYDSGDIGNLRAFIESDDYRDNIIQFNSYCYEYKLQNNLLP